MTTVGSSSPQGKPASQLERSLFSPNLAQRYRLDVVFAIILWLSIFIALTVLLTLVIDIALDGIPRLNWQFLSSFPSRNPERAGIKSALAGSLWILMGLIVVGLPVGIGSGIFLEEFAGRNRFTQFLEININNLAGVPSIIYGLLGLELFVRWLEPLTGGRSVLSGVFTLSLLVMPIIIVATREALRAVPNGLRDAAYALGARRWQVVFGQVLPLAFPGIMTGTILALSRAVGETASLITIGALTFVAFLPPVSLEGLRSSFTVMPIQTYNWISRPQEAFRVNAAAAIVVLLLLLLVMNGTAVYLRNRYQTTRV